MSTDITTVPAIPPLEDVIAQLVEIAAVDSVDPDVAIEDLEVDSLDLIEWACALEDEYGLRVNDEDLQRLAAMSIRQLYDEIIAGALV